MLSSTWTRPRSALAAVSGAGLLAATLAGAGPVQALPADPAGLTDLASLTDGGYVVVLKDEPAATYTGGVRGLAATQPAEGERLSAADRDVQRYSAHLEDSQSELADAVGVEPTYTYTAALNGFSAQLTAEQATQLAADDDVLAVVPDEARSIDTVASPEFLGLSGRNGVWAGVGGVEEAGKGTVVGIIDTGIWPANPSFAGDPVTARSGDRTQVGSPYRGADGEIDVLKADGSVFSGQCEAGEDFTADLCNDKMVSARYFASGFVAAVPPGQRAPSERISPLDGDGHGSHTAGTAVGNHDVQMTVDGRDFGRGSGVAPAAHLAVYKVCWSDTNPNTGGCYTSDSVAAIDRAVLDGVDVLNYSISGSTTTVIDPVELAFMRAAAAGVFVAASAGNSGPGPSTVAHNSPWLTTVAASTHVSYEGTVELGDGRLYRGASTNDQPLPQTATVLSTGLGLAGRTPVDVALCAPGSLTPGSATGQIVVCDRGVYDRVSKSAEVARIGGVGLILANTTPGSLDADLHTIPTVHVDEVAGAAIKAYVRGASAPTAALLTGDQTDLPPTPVPVAAGFSSRGPALANEGDLLKPDISAPGVSVLAAVAPTSSGGRDFNFLSGTSMSSPHIAGLAALIVAERPQWSPMAVKSAMMTTAYDLEDATGAPDNNVFNAGAGHVDPTRFLNPGVVFDSAPADWLRFLVGQGADLGDPGIEALDASDLNQPSIAIGSLAGSQTVTRSATAVRAGTYRATYDVPGFDVRVSPAVLRFSEAGQTRSFQVTFTRTTAELGSYAQGHLNFTGGRAQGRMPVAIRPVSVAAPAEVTAPASASGSTTFQVTPGSTGPLPMQVRGLVPGQVTDSSVAVGGLALNPTGNAATRVHRFQVPAGTTLARFDLQSGEDDADLDLYLVNPTFTAFAAPQAAGATAGADERIELRNPAPGNYYVLVHGFSSSDGQPVDFSLRNFAVGSTDLGNASVTPNPLQGVQGRPSDVTVSWSGLTPGTPYLGWIGYQGSTSPTVVAIG